MQEKSQLKHISYAPHRMALTMCLGGWIYAYCTVALTSLSNLIKIKNDLSDTEIVEELSITTATLNLGAFLGPLAYRKLVDHFGEIKTMLIIDTIGIAAVSVQLIELSFWYLVVGRLIVGILMGISTSIIPVYINSISPVSIAGKLGTFNQLLIVFGVLVCYSVSFFVDDQDKNDEIQWRIVIGLPIFVFLLRIIILQVFYPFDTLERLISQGQTEKLKKFCSKVYGEGEEKVETLIRMKKIDKSTHSHSSTKKIRLIIALFVITANQLSGINAILYYAKQLFNKITNDDIFMTKLLMIGLAIIQIVATFIGAFSASRRGRKSIIIFGLVTVAILMFLLYLSYDFLSLINQIVSEAIMGGFLFLFILFFNMSLGSFCIVYCSQIVEDITWVVVALKGWALLIALGADFMIQFLGLGKMFLLFSISTTVIFLFLRTRLHQTKGLTANEIYPLFSKQRNDQSKKSLLQEEQSQQT